jgi:galactose mutarotase-like enzyme
MPHVFRRPSGDSDALEEIVLTDESADSRAVVVPGRGAIVTSFETGGRELLYLDRPTLLDATKNVRGGIPVLFPSPGKLDGDAFVHEGQTFAMKQHGFARNLPWAVDPLPSDAARVVLSLESSAVTRAQYPWGFRVALSLSLSGSTLRLAQRVENRSASAMPFAFGFHPYFLVTDKAGARVDTRATRAFDNVTKKEVPFTGFDFTQAEVDMHLIDHGSTESALHLGDGQTITVRGSQDYTRWVVWTVAGKDYVCLEPWTAPGNALNTGASLIHIAPGGAHESWIEVSAGS